MKTIFLAVIIFLAALAGVIAYRWYMAPAPEQAKDSQQPNGTADTPPSDVPSLEKAFSQLQAAYGWMDSTCTAEARKAYGAAYMTFLAAVDKEQTAGTYSDSEWYSRRNWMMHQFVDASSRGVIAGTDMPDADFGRMVAYLNKTGVLPLTDGEKRFGSRYSDADGKPMKSTRCEPLPRDG